MKKIADYRKLLGVEKSATLSDLKSTYRTLMKDWHPDKFQEESQKLTAEAKSKDLIEAYHFLVSVAPETHELERETYTAVVNSSRIIDYQYKGQILQLHFADGSSYEYFEVPKNIINKMANAATLDRFARRHIYHSFPYRRAAKAVETAA